MNVNNVNDLAHLHPFPGAVGQKVDVADDVVQFAAFVTNAEKVLVSVDTQAVRVTFDATNPDTTVGHLLPTGYVAVWSVALATAAKFHQGAGGAGVVYGTEVG